MTSKKQRIIEMFQQEISALQLWQKCEGECERDYPECCHDGSRIFVCAFNHLCHNVSFWNPPGKK